ncbi:AEC family transporter [Vaginisenegalia massiliensis]|uniref:AEC family transporter n=1 Tax=Vaginisenegalia massiliensis TaxID=2058294 RepID=UPI000F528680|nr:AEC family transporter [Vaginisenegalia massiliensis]
MNISQVIAGTFSNPEVLSAIASTVLIILVGFYCRRKGIFGENVAKVLSNLVLKVALPALAFTAFMKPINPSQLSQSMGVLIWGIALYIILIFLTPLFYMKFPKDRQTTLSVLSVFGSTTFFGIPMIAAIYGDEGTIYANIFNIGYRIFLYTWAYVTMSGLKFEKKNLKQIFGNLIVIATFLGLFIWVFQGSLPQVTVAGEKVAFLRIDTTAPWLFDPMKYLSSLASPLAWLSIGAQLGEVDFKKAASNKIAWYYSFIKVVMVPLINLVGILILNALGILDLQFIAIAATAIMMATPTATVAAAYAIGFDRDALLTSNASLLSTLAAVIAIPIWIVILQVLSTAGLF